MCVLPACMSMRVQRFLITALSHQMLWVYSDYFLYLDLTLVGFIYLEICPFILDFSIHRFFF